MRHTLKIVAVLGLASTLGHAAPIPEDAKEGPKRELARLSGEWEIVSYTMAGEVLIDEKRKSKLRITFSKEGEFKFIVDGEDGDEGKITSIDPSKKPKEIDYVFSNDVDKKVQKAIYKLEGDTFSDCCAPAGEKERPTEFKSTAENKCALLVYKRVKKID